MKRSSGMSRLMGSLDAGLDEKLTRDIDFSGYGDESRSDDAGRDVYGDRIAPSQLTLAMVLAYDGNIADLMDEEGDYGLRRIGELVVSEYELDESARRDWKEGAERALRDAGMRPRDRKKFPYPDASNVQLPVLTTSAIQFQARAYPAIVRGDEVVECKTKGKDNNGAKAKRGERVSGYINDQLIYQCDEWEPGTDSLLLSLPIVGQAYRKIYWDESLDRPRLDFCTALDVIVPMDAPSMEMAPRVTQIVRKYPYEYGQLVHAGVWRPAKVQRDSGDSQKPLLFLEQVRYCDLDGDGLAEPYIVTAYKETHEVVRIDPAFDEDDVTARQKYDEQTGEPIEGEFDIIAIKRCDPWVDYTFLPDPNGGAYGIGFGHLLDHLTQVINTMVNQMIDAGTWANTMTGFVGAGVKTRGGVMQMEPNKFKYLDGVTDVRAALMRLEHPGPSPVQFQMIEFLLEQLKDITAVKDVLTGDAPGQQPATSTLALIEQAQQVYNSIYKRIFRSMKKEMAKLCRLNQRYLSREKYQDFLDDRGDEQAPASPPAQPSPMMGHNGGPPMTALDMGGPMPQAPGIGQGPGGGVAQGPGLDAAGGGIVPPGSNQPPPAGGASVIPFPNQPGAGIPPGGAPPQAMPQPPQIPPKAFTPEEDFNLDDMDIQPLADPAAVTEMQRLAKANFVAQLILNDPAADRVQALRYLCQAARLPDIDKLVPENNASLQKQAQIMDANAQADLAQKAATTAKLQAETQKIGGDAQTAAADAQLRQQEMQAKAQEQAFNQQKHADEMGIKAWQAAQGDAKLALEERAQMREDFRAEGESHDREMQAMGAAEDRSAQREDSAGKMELERDRAGLERDRFAAEDDDRRESRGIEREKMEREGSARDQDRDLERERLASDDRDKTERRITDRQKVEDDREARTEDRGLERDRMTNDEESKNKDRALAEKKEKREGEAARRDGDRADKESEREDAVLQTMREAITKLTKRVKELETKRSASANA